MHGWDRWLRMVLVAMVAATNLWALSQLLAAQPLGVDLEIPLRAAERWGRGEPPYLPASFQFSGGPDLPFLYPPPVILAVAPLVTLPRVLVLGAWVAICALAGAFVCRRLGIGAAWWPLALTWPPFAEAIVGGNVQVLLILAFVTLFFAAPAGRWRQRLLAVRLPEPVDPAHDRRPAIVSGALGVLPAAVKISQIHSLVYVARRRPRAAALGIALAAAVAAVTLPIVGVGSWAAWLEQAGRATDPSWRANGAPLAAYAGRVPGLAISAASVLAVLFVPPRRAGAWIGILALLGAPAVHMFTILFLLPAILTVRRELGLVAAALVATYLAPLIWLAVGLVGWGLLASARWPRLLEPGPLEAPAT